MATISLAVLGALLLAGLAIVMRQVRAARAALRACEETAGHRTELVDLERTIEADGRLAGDAAHDLNDLLTAIVGNTELLIASLDPNGAGILEAYEIRRAALSAAQITKPLGALGGGRGAPGGTPFAFVAPPAVDPSASSEPAEATRSQAAVLVVDDEPGVRQLIKSVLTRAGYRIVAVDGPRDALTALRRQPAIALMLVDLVMPDVDGYDLAAEARAMLPDVRVVFMSAFGRDPHRQAEADRFLQKPFTTDDLLGIVEAALDDA